MAKSKIIADYARKVTNEDGDLEITFVVKNWNYKKYCQTLEKKPYALELAEVRSKRSINQNNYLWALIGEINQAESGGRDDDWDIYCALLEKANAKYIYMDVLTEAVETLKEHFRALHVMKTHENGNKQFSVCKCYLGSSKMNKEEMGQLIEATLDHASQIGLDIEFYKDVLR